MLDRVGATERGINHPEVDTYLAQQSWDIRVNTFLKLMAQLDSDSSGDKSDSSPQVLDSFVETHADYENYLRVLEPNLAETQRWARELEAQAMAKERELERIRRFLPMRLLIGMRDFFKRRSAWSLAGNDE